MTNKWEQPEVKAKQKREPLMLRLEKALARWEKSVRHRRTVAGDNYPTACTAIGIAASVTIVAISGALGFVVHPTVALGMLLSPLGLLPLAWPIRWSRDRCRCDECNPRPSSSRKETLR